ncbi:hypothetical protein [Nostoc sp.]|uniref:hypothetical protein n=1 Tax=Nostoc sp. TaxID=1180 RepID=UPI002FF4A748
MEPEVQHPPWYVEPNEGESISHYFGRFRRHEAVCVSSPGTLSKAAGIGPVLARWEKFRFNPFPSQKELEAIAKLIGLDVDRIAQMLPPKGEKMKMEPIRLCAACYAEQPYHRLEGSFNQRWGASATSYVYFQNVPFAKSVLLSQRYGNRENVTNVMPLLEV